MKILLNLSSVRLQIKPIYTWFIFLVQFKYLKQRILHCLESGTDSGLIRDTLLNIFTHITSEQTTFDCLYYHWDYGQFNHWIPDIQSRQWFFSGPLFQTSHWIKWLGDGELLYCPRSQYSPFSIFLFSLFLCFSYFSSNKHLPTVHLLSRDSFLARKSLQCVWDLSFPCLHKHSLVLLMLVSSLEGVH